MIHDTASSTSSGNSFVETSQDNVSLTHKKYWKLILRLIIDSIFILTNLGCLIYVLIQSHRETTNVAYVGFRTIGCFLGGPFGICCLYFIIRSFFIKKIGFLNRDCQMIKDIFCIQQQSEKKRVRHLKKEWSSLIEPNHLHADDKNQSEKYHCFQSCQELDQSIRLTRRHVSEFCTHSIYALAAMTWNILWCIVWAISTIFWKADPIKKQWDFDNVPEPFYLLQSTFLSGLTFDICLKFIRHIQLFDYIFTLEFCLDIVTLPPVTLVLAQSSFFGGSHRFGLDQYLLSVGWVRWIRAFVIVRFVKRVVLARESQAVGFVMSLVTGLTIALIAFASAMFTFEGVNFLPEKSNNLLTFVYFGIVTLSTVGYGDIAPITVLGRICTIVFILLILAWVPTQLRDLFDVLRGKTHQQVGTLPSRRQVQQFAILCGDVSEEQLSLFMHDFLKTDRSRIRKLLVVTLRPETTYRQQLREARKLQLSLCIRHAELGLGGYPELERHYCIPECACAVFVLCDVTSTHWVDDDRQTVTRVLGLRKLGVDPRRMCVQLHTTAVVSIIRSLGVNNIVVLESIRMSLFVKHCCDCEGIFSLIGNLISSFSARTDIVKDLGRYVTMQNNLEYLSGALCTIRRFRIPSIFHGSSSIAVILDLFIRYGVIMFAVQRWQIAECYILNPSILTSVGRSPFLLQEDDWGIIITRDVTIPSTLEALSQPFYLITGKRVTQTVVKHEADEVQLEAYPLSSSVMKSYPPKHSPSHETEQLTSDRALQETGLDSSSSYDDIQDSHSELHISRSQLDSDMISHSNSKSSNDREKILDRPKTLNRALTQILHSGLGNDPRSSELLDLSADEHIDDEDSETVELTRQLKTIVSQLTPSHKYHPMKSKIKPSMLHKTTNMNPSIDLNVNSIHKSGLKSDKSVMYNRHDKKFDHFSTTTMPGYHHTFIVSSYLEAIENCWKNKTLPFILVCGWTRNFISFIKHIHLQGLFNILVIRTKILTIEEAYQFPSECCAIINGNSVAEVNLLRAGVLQARWHLILSDELTSSTKPCKDDLFTSDRDTVIVYLKIQHLLKFANKKKTLSKHIDFDPSLSTTNIKNSIMFNENDKLLPHSIITMLRDIHHVYFIDPIDSYPGLTYLHDNTEIEMTDLPLEQFSSLYASGLIYSDSLLLRLVAHSPYLSDHFVDPHLFRLLVGLPSGLPHTNIFNKQNHRIHGIRLLPSNVQQSEGELFVHLFETNLKEKGLLIIGLYRIRQNIGFQRYVIACPVPNTRVYRHDKIYVIDTTEVSLDLLDL